MASGGPITPIQALEPHAPRGWRHPNAPRPAASREGHPSGTRPGWAECDEPPAGTHRRDRSRSRRGGRGRSRTDLLRLENLDVDILPDETAITRTKDAASTDADNSYLRDLGDLPIGVPASGWSLLLRTTDFGIDGATLSERLLEHGVAATPMTGWGETHAGQYLRFVFANEPAGRLALLGERLRAALRL